MTAQQNAVTIVKRYRNRKLYDTQASKYITVTALADLVTSGASVQVVDHATNTDITGQTLLQALVEVEPNAADQTETLQKILRAGGLSKYLAGLQQTGG